MKWVIFEDELWQNFLPLTLTRPSFDLILGGRSLLEEVRAHFGEGSSFLLLVRSYLAPVTRRRHPGFDVNSPEVDDAFFLNAMIAPKALQTSMETDRDEIVATSGRNVAFARLKRRHAADVIGENPPALSGKLIEVGKREGILKGLPDDALLRFPWKLVLSNGDAITWQCGTMKGGRLAESSVEGKVLGSTERVFLGERVAIEEQALLDVRRGPIVVGSGSQILGPSRVEGPVWIGKNATIKGALVGPGTTIGDHVKIGGEVENSIVMPYSNKAHGGYLGHSYVGEWVNIGATSTTSDLKNTYGTVKMALGGSSRMDTGTQKLGCFIGDNAKLAIGTMTRTGLRIGVASHVYGTVLEDVPSFAIYARSWGLKVTELYLDSAVETQRRMMERRGVEQSEEERELLRKVFEDTSEERAGAGAVKERFELI